jgi:hypothetical protein
MGATQFAHTPKGVPTADTNKGVYIAVLCSLTRQHSKKGQSCGSEEKSKSHSNFIGLQPVQRRAPHMLLQRHGVVHGVYSSESDGSRDFNARALAVFFVEGWVAGANPERSCNAKQEHHREKAALYRTRARKRKCRFQRSSLCFHHFLRGTRQSLG